MGSPVRRVVHVVAGGILVACVIPSIGWVGEVNLQNSHVRFQGDEFNQLMR